MNYIKGVKLFNHDKLDTVNMIIEIEKGSKDKNELVDGTFDKLECVRKIKQKYPFYYGSFPQTYAGDKDPADAILLTDVDHKALRIVKVLPVALIKTVDNGEEDNKIICIEGEIKNLEKQLTNVLKFLCTYKGKNADTVVDGTIYGVNDAISALRHAHEEYKRRNPEVKAQKVERVETKAKVANTKVANKNINTIKVN